MNKYLYTVSALLLSFLLCAAVPVLAQNKVTDGNFEDGTPFTDPTDIANQYQVFTVAKPMKYWSVTVNTVRKDNKSYLGMGTPAGGLDHHIDVNPFGGIAQVMHDLVPGTKYALTFYVRGHAYISSSCVSTGAATMQVDVGKAGALLSDIIVLTKADMGWSKKTYEFIATEDSALLSFTGTGSCTGAGGVLVDKIEVVASGTDPCVPYVHFAKAGRDTGFCKVNDTALVTLSASGGESYAWSPAGYFADPKLATATAKITTTTTFIVTVTNEYGCLDKDTVVVNVYPEAHISASPASVSACAGTTAALHATGGISYAWSPSAGLDADKSADPVLTLMASGPYIVTGTNEQGCTAKDTIDVTVFALPDLDITTDKLQLDCFNSQAQLSVTGTQQYRWEPAVYCETPDKNSTIVHPPFTTVFSVTGTSDQGCSATDTIRILLEGASVVRMPTAFTPNGDRLNDEARPVVYCDFELDEFSIYNRAGKRMFRTNNMQQGWDGTYQGTPCDGNVYFYMIRGKDHNGSDVMVKGDITLVR